MKMRMTSGWGLVILLAAWLPSGCQSYDRNTECDPALGGESYTCPDDSQVPWCTCEAGTWDCEPEPQKACQDIPACQTDRNCEPDAWCDPCATSSCADCGDCVPGCLLHGCPTEPQPDCRMARPECDPGQVSVVVDGCWVCVDALTCEEPAGRDEHCDDQTVLSCGQAEPDCNDWEIPSIRDGCWLCVDPDTCRPWDEPGCSTDLDCRPEDRCDDCAHGSCPDCEDCVADCAAHGCPTEAVPECNGLRPECGDGAVAVVRDGCWVCVDLATCEPTRDTSCDDGSQALCNTIPPVCEDYEILAVQDECWICVNPATCAPWGQPGCSHDADCDPDRWCNPCASGTCPMCPDCVAGCTVHGCETQGYDQLECQMPRPDCGGGAVAVIRDGCWVCVGLDACAPIEPDTHCDDGTEALCEMPTPVCKDYEILAVQDHCWVCVNPTSCVPWGQPGCQDDAGCDPADFCNPCGTSSCPDCDDCLSACTSHGCATEQELGCFCARPDCGDDAFSVIRDACWICVDAQTCEPTGDGC